MVTACSKRTHRRWTLVLVASIFASVLATSASAHRSEFTPGKWPSHTVLIGYSSEQALETALRGRGARVVARVPSLRTVAVRPSGDAASFAADVAGASGIDFVQPPVRRHALVEPALTPAAVPGGAYQWQYVLTGADRVPDRIRSRSRRIRIGIVDSGADLSAPDLEGKRPMTYNAIDNSRDVKDVVGHGTFVASLAAGSSSNGEGMAGIAGEARLITIKASSAGMFTDFELAAAIAYAVDNGAKIVNLSLGGPSASRTEVRALEYALTKDVLLVAAAGNSALEGNPVVVPRSAPPAAELERRRRVRARPSAHRRSPARAPTSPTTARTSRSPPRAKRSSARSRRTRRPSTSRVSRCPARRRGSTATAAARRSPRRRSPALPRSSGRRTPRSAHARSRTSSSRPRREAASGTRSSGSA